MALAAGKILGQYEIRSLIGAGGMGEVYRAHDTRLNREVAIKVLPHSLTSDPDRLRRFEQEARAAAALNHPNILAVYQMATQDHISYLVSELLEGETLRDRLRRGLIPLHKAIEYEVQVARGLAAAHEKGIVHRDLKPENLFITKDGRIKILDFGLAKLTQRPQGSGAENTITRATDPGIVVGTASYMSPEQVRGANADHRSDIFAFGTILFEVVTGKQTFHKPTSAETMSAILNEEPPSVSQLTPTVPPGLQRVVHRCLEKEPERRFQSASDLAFALEALSDSAISSSTSPRPQAGAKSHRWKFIVGAATLVVIAATILAYFEMQPPVVPKVSKYVQLTHDGLPKNLNATDGSRIYLFLISSGYQGMGEMSVSGGDPRKLTILPSTNMFAWGLSPDASQLLVTDPHGIPPEGSLWSIPLLGGSPRKLGDLTGSTASWSPDGKFVAYGRKNEVYLATADGNDPRKLATIEGAGVILSVAWSPDSKRLRFTYSDFTVSASSLWEVSTDGTNLHTLFPGWHSPANECCGTWTTDGKYFVFSSQNQIWTIPEKTGWFSSPKPVQLTSSPMALSAPLPSKDGKQIFVIGATIRGELMRYNSKSGEFVPYLGGISAEFSAFSPDGQWVAYVSFPDGTLWRSKVDGSERLQLTSPPSSVLLPRWSPDGKQIAFHQLTQGKAAKIYVVSPEGGSPRALMPDDSLPEQDPNWSPDSKQIVFGGDANDPKTSVHILDLQTGNVSQLPGSQGMFSPRWSPNGRYIATLSADSKTVSLFDLKTQKWSELISGTLGYPNWSKDGQHLYLLDIMGASTVLKVRLSDRKVERVVDLKGFPMTGHYGSSMTIAPDDSPLIVRDAGTYDVYALDWETP